MIARRVQIFCPRCREVTWHVLAGGVASCQIAGCYGSQTLDEMLHRSDEALVPPVEDMRDCGWCGGKRPVGHQCIGDGQTPCPTPEGAPCGMCERCIAAQESDARYPQNHDPRRSRHDR